MNTINNLILKTLAKIQIGASAAWKITKNKVLPCVIVGSMVLTMAACTQKDADTDTGSSQTGSSWSDTNDSNLSPDNSTDSSTDISTDTSTDTSKPEEDKLSSYSPLVREMLTETYYLDLVHRRTYDTYSCGLGWYDPHPYAFLEEQGHDVLAVKKSEKECHTHAFVNANEPNNLYIATYIESNNNFYSEYLLRYTLSDKEMEDYKLFHDKNYVQAVFLNDWISANKPATIISKLDVDIATHNGIQERLRVSNRVETTLQTDNEQLFLIFHSLDKESNTFSVYAMKYVNSDNMIHNSNFTDISMIAWKDFNFDNNSLFYYSYDQANYGIFGFSDTKRIKQYCNQGTPVSLESSGIKDAFKD